MEADGAGYLTMPRILGKQYFHRQLLEDSGAAYAGHEMVVHHEDGDICNNCEELNMPERMVLVGLDESQVPGDCCGPLRGSQY